MDCRNCGGQQTVQGKTCIRCGAENHDDGSVSYDARPGTVEDNIRDFDRKHGRRRGEYWVRD